MDIGEREYLGWLEAKCCYNMNFLVLLVDWLMFFFQSCTGHVLCSILLNSADLLRVDLQGVQVLLPHLITALETVLPRNDIQIRSEFIILCSTNECSLFP